MSKISLYSTCFQTSNSEKIDFDEYLEGIKDGKWQDSVLNYRAGKSKKEKNPAITASGFFENNRQASQLTEHSGFLCIDIDQKENPDVLSKREQIGCDPYVYAFHTSIGGFGLAIYFKIKKNKHLDSFHAIEKYLADNYQLISDPSCKDVSRLRFVSYDPDLYINKNSKTWSDFLPKKQAQTFNFNPIFTNNDIDFIINQIITKGIDLTYNYTDWLKIGFSLCSEYGERGRDYFHAVSRFHPDYDFQKTDRKYDSILKSGSQKFRISTFLWIAKQNDIKIKTPNTQRIETVTQLRKKTIGKTGGFKDEEEAKKDAVKYLTEVEKIDKNIVNETVEKVFNSKSDIEDEKEISDVEKITEYIKSLPLKHNTVTNCLEFNGNEITDKIENSIFLNCREILPKCKVSKDLILSVLNSDRIREYNPFLDFFEKNSYTRPKGRIIDLIDSLSIPNNKYAPYCFNFIEKWLLSIIASMHGTHSVYILVFTGEQMTGKTKFFRNLLPDDLSHYFAESKLDRDKDDEMLMSKKLLILDDEFAGKSKKESTKLKELASKQTITQRKAYGRNIETFNRYGVLCGTSNDDDIINDPTGNRRVIPVKILNIDFEKFDKVNKTELFMELFWKWKEIKDGWMLSKEEVKYLNENTKDFYEVSMEEDLIRKNFTPSNKSDFAAEFMTATQMISYCEGYLSKQRLYHKKFGQILKKLGFERDLKGSIYGYFVRKINEIT